MGYTNWCVSIKLKLKHFTSEHFDKWKNKFVKGWSPGSSLIRVIDIESLTVLKIDVINHTFVKYIYEATVTFTPRGTPFGIQLTYCYYFNMKHVARSEKFFRHKDNFL